MEIVERAGIEDPLSYLPCSAITEYRKGQIIYDVDLPSRHLYLVIEGCVKVGCEAGHSEIALSLCQADDFFGESAFLRVGGERAIALESTKVMCWPVETIQELIAKNPGLGVALVQMLTKRCVDMGERIATLSVDSTSRRLAKALLHLSERFGQTDPDSPDKRRLSPFSHKILAQYLGTTREAVTHCMNQFRRNGLLAYSRRGMILSVGNIQEWLETEQRRPARTPEPPVEQHEGEEQLYQEMAH